MDSKQCLLSKGLEKVARGTTREAEEDRLGPSAMRGTSGWAALRNPIYKAHKLQIHQEDAAIPAL